MNPTRRRFLWTTGAAGAALSFTGLRWLGAARAEAAPARSFAVTRSDAEWRKLLTPDQYEVLRQEGTEHPYSSPLNDQHGSGVFACAGCAQALFSSNTKFDSGTGWPSFWQPLDKAVLEDADNSLGITRTAVSCSRCGGHLGHVFDDGPRPTGLRYCMNGVAMTFKPAAA
jgi:peptide-methionine (R)-S-oxide reductase